MEKTNNQKAFDELPETAFFKTDAALYAVLRGVRFEENAVGFDVETDGFLAVHRRHSLAALEQEVPACLVLKKLGFGVVLLRESETHNSPDAQINGQPFEIKLVAKAKNGQRSILWQFRKAYSKCPRLLLQIDQKMHESQLRGAIFIASKQYPQIETVWVIFQDALFQFSRAQIKSGKHHFQTKK